MHSRLCLRVARRGHTPQVAQQASRRAPLSSTARRGADDPVRDIQNATTPSTSPAPNQEPAPSRDPAEPSDASNPLLQGYPSRTGRQTTSTATPDTTTPESAPEVRSRSNVPIGTATPNSRQQNSNATSRLLDQFTRSATNTGRGRIQRKPNEPLAGGAAVKKMNDERFAVSDAKILNYQPRRWLPGDVYSPHDLTPAEARKNQSARSSAMLRFKQPPSRRAAKDVLDELHIDPRQHYTNFAMMGEFVSSMGKINQRFITQLRLKNQRRVAKAVRRAIGIGLVPSVHQHPELYDERADQQGFSQGLKGARGRGVRTP